MKKLLATLASVLLGLPCALAQQDIVSFSSVTATYNDGGSYTLGYEFIVTIPITVIGLSAFDDTPTTGLKVDTPIGLWNGNRSLIASDTVLAGTVAPLTLDGYFRYVSLNTPLILADGTYYVGAISTANSGNYSFYVNGLSAVSGVTYIGTAMINSSGLQCPALLAPTRSGIFGGNVVIAPVPEPQSGQLLCLGLVGGICLMVFGCPRSGVCETAKVCRWIF